MNQKCNRKIYKKTGQQAFHPLTSRFFGILDLFEPAEHNHARDVQHPVALFFEPRIHHTERNLVALFDCIKFMLFLRPVKIDFAVTCSLEILLPFQH